MRAFPEGIDKIDRDLTLWQGVLNHTTPDYRIAYDFLIGNLEIYDIQKIFEGDPSKLYQQASRIILDALKNTSFSSIVKMIKNTDIEPCSSDSIPMFSSLDDSYITELSILSFGDESFESVGAKLPGCRSNNKPAMHKYGETHSKLIALLDLAWIIEEHPYRVTISPLGVEFKKRTIAQRSDLFRKMIFKIPVIRNTYRKDVFDLYSVRDEVSHWVNNSTVDRRSSSVMKLLIEMNDECCDYFIESEDGSLWTAE